MSVIQPKSATPLVGLVNHGRHEFQKIKKYEGGKGKALHFFSATYKVRDENTNKIFYIKKKDIENSFSSGLSLNKTTKQKIKKRVKEITDPSKSGVLSAEKLKTLYLAFHNPLKAVPNNPQALVNKLETVKQEVSDIPHLFFQDSINEITNQLVPGDILVRKYHEDNPNAICDLQNMGKPKGYREANKCSHLAIYVGEIQGKHYIAEASMPHGNESQIRYIEIDDPRFDLAKKNQYLVFRNKDQEVAKETARLAKRYAHKMLPQTEQKPTQAHKKYALKYDFIEALRSLWHSSKLGFYGKHRMLKNYADYKNGIAAEYLGTDRKYFCSHFVVTMLSQAEMNKSADFQTFIDKHPVPKLHNKDKKGIVKFGSKLSYSIRKGFWSRAVALGHGRRISKSVKTQLDALRTNPQDAVLYMMKNSNQFQTVGLITRANDLKD